MLSWSKRAPDGPGRFIADGPLDWGGWESAKPRVLFLMKEAYDEKLEEGKWLDKPDFGGTPLANRWTLSSLMLADIKSDWLRSTWKNLFLWARAMLEFDPLLPPSSEVSDQGKGRFDLLRSCAVVNLKKYDGQKKSSDEDLRNHLSLGGPESNCEMLRRQIQLLRPDTVIACGTFDLAREAFAGKEPMESSAVDSYEGVHRFGETVWFDYWHPAWYQVPRFLLVQGLHAMRVRFEAVHGPIFPSLNPQ